MVLVHVAFFLLLQDVLKVGVHNK